MEEYSSKSPSTELFTEIQDQADEKTLHSCDLLFGNESTTKPVSLTDTASIAFRDEKRDVLLYYEYPPSDPNGNISPPTLILSTCNREPHPHAAKSAYELKIPDTRNITCGIWGDYVYIKQAGIDDPHRSNWKFYEELQIICWKSGDTSLKLESPGSHKTAICLLDDENMVYCRNDWSSKSYTLDVYNFTQNHWQDPAFRLLLHSFCRRHEPNFVTCKAGIQLAEGDSAKAPPVPDDDERTIVFDFYQSPRGSRISPKRIWSREVRLSLFSAYMDAGSTGMDIPWEDWRPSEADDFIEDCEKCPTCGAAGRG